MPKGKLPCVAVKRSEDKNKIMRLPNLQENHDLWYKIQVLVHDLCNIANDRTAESCTLATTDELYISGPYFTPSEAILIKTTLISPPILNEVPEFEALGFEEAEEEDVGSRRPLVPPGLITIEEAIKSCLRNFFEKRRASGDARPCGPHDMGPIYLAVFGIAKADLKDEKFLSRLRRAGLPRLEEVEIGMGERSEQKAKKGGRKGA